MSKVQIQHEQNMSLVLTRFFSASNNHLRIVVDVVVVAPPKIETIV
jgi:hypothetical protein